MNLTRIVKCLAFSCLFLLIAHALPTERPVLSLTKKATIEPTDGNISTPEQLPLGCKVYKNRTPVKTVTLLQCKNAGLQTMPNVNHKFKIEAVDLSQNNISRVHLPSGYDKVKRIDLENNMITTLLEEMLAEFKYLQKLYIGNNPFHCDCKLEWLRDRLLSSNNTSPRFGKPHDIKCVSPTMFHDRALKTVTKDELCGMRSAKSKRKLATSTKQTALPKNESNSTVQLPDEHNPDSNEKGRWAEIVGVTFAFVSVIVIMSVIFLAM